MKNMYWTAALGLFALNAAADEASPPATYQPGFYLVASVGQMDQEFSKDQGMNFAIVSPFGGGVFHAFPDSIDVDNDDQSWKGTLGYRINKYLAAELSYVDFGESDVTERYTFADTPIPFFPSELTRDYVADVSGPLVSVMGILPLGSRFEVFVRAGMLFADQEIEQTFPSGSQSDTFGSEIWVGGAGLEWHFASRWSARLEYLRTDTIDKTPMSGSSELDDLSLGILFDL